MEPPEILEPRHVGATSVIVPTAVDSACAKPALKVAKPLAASLGGDRAGSGDAGLDLSRDGVPTASAVPNDRER